MLWHRVVLIPVVSLLGNHEVLFTATSSDQGKNTLAADSTANVASANSVVTNANARRSLRADESAEGDAILTNGYSVDDGNDIDSEERVSTWQWLVSKVNSKGSTTTPITDKTLERYVEEGRTRDEIMNKMKLTGLSETDLATRVNRENLDKLWDVLVKKWDNENLPVKRVLEKLGLGTLQPAERIQVFEKFVNHHFKRLSKSGLNPDAMLPLLGLDNLSGAALTADPNFKLFDDFWKAEVKEWETEGDVSVDDVVRKLGLNKLNRLNPLPESPEAVIYTYYVEFVKYRLDLRTSNNLTPNEMMVHLGINQLPVEKLTAASRFELFDEFWKEEVTKWKTQDVSVGDVVERLGLKRLNTQPDAVRPHAVIYTYYEMFVKSRSDLWTSKNLTPNEMMVHLRIDQLSGATLEADMNFKLFDGFCKEEFTKWKTQDLSVNKVLERLGLNTLLAADRPHAVSYRYYGKFVKSRFDLWQNLTPNEMMIYLGLDQLSGSALEADMNFKLFDGFWKEEVMKWKNPDVSVDDVLNKLGLNRLSLNTQPDVDRPHAVIYTYYGDFVKSRFDLWTSKNLTPNETMVHLGIDQLSGAALEADINLKYFDEFWKDEVKKWKTQKLSVDDVLKRLGLQSLTATERTEALMYTYYGMFVELQFEIWSSQKLNSNEVMVRLGIDQLSGEALTTDPRFEFFDDYWEEEAKKCISSTNTGTIMSRVWD